MNAEKIDFVILWVDEKDPKWLEEKRKYSHSTMDDASEKRYRNWENFQYFFRGVEKFAPWVNKIFLSHMVIFLNG